MFLSSMLVKMNKKNKDPTEIFKLNSTSSAITYYIVYLAFAVKVLNILTVILLLYIFFSILLNTFLVFFLIKSKPKCCS